MHREINTHKVNGLNEALKLLAVDHIGPGGANHIYVLQWDSCGCGTRQLQIDFQNGPITESGVNGVSNEALLAIVIDRLQGFQSGQYSCRENSLALTKLQEAMHWLHHRTRERLARGVEGTSAK